MQQEMKQTEKGIIPIRTISLQVDFSTDIYIPKFKL